MPATVSFDDVSKRFSGVPAIRGVSFEVNKGEVLGLLGASGAGKSTLLHMLAGLVRPDGGSITVFGKELNRNFAEIAARMGVLCQAPVFFEHLTVRRNLLLQAALAGKAASVTRVLNWVGLLDAAGARVHRLGGEQRQRLGLAQALITEPELLVLDEPTLGLDAEASEELFRLIRRIARSGEVTVLLASHLMYEVEALCDRVALLHEGRIVACAETSEVISYDPSQVEVLLEGADTAAKRLKELVWVGQVDVQPGRLYVHLQDRNVHQLCAYLVQAGFKINGVIPRRRTLQEYLIKVLNP
jgi:ABC-2 type transport system ATP-binding protein